MRSSTYILRILTRSAPICRHAQHGTLVCGVFLPMSIRRVPKTVLCECACVYPPRNRLRCGTSACRCDTSTAHLGSSSRQTNTGTISSGSTRTAGMRHRHCSLRESNHHRRCTSVCGAAAFRVAVIGGRTCAAAFPGLHV